MGLRGHALGLALLGLVCIGKISGHSGGSGKYIAEDLGEGMPNCSEIQEAAKGRPPQGTEEKPIFLGVVPVFSVLAIFGGGFSLGSLLNPPMRVPANKYFIGLSTSAILLGISGLFTFVYKLLDIDYKCRERYEGYFIIGGVYFGIIGGRILIVFMVLFGIQRLVTNFFPVRSKRFVLTKYPMVTLLSTMAICVFFTPSLFEFAVGKIKPYHPNATLYLTMAPNFGASFPINTDGQITINVVQHVLSGIILVLAICNLTGYCMQRGSEENEEVLKEKVITRAYLALVFLYVLSLAPSFAVSTMSYIWRDFTHKGSQRANFLMAFNIHYMVEIVYAGLMFPLMMMTYTYFRHSLALLLGCKTPEDAQVLVAKTDDDE